MGRFNCFIESDFANLILTNRDEFPKLAEIIQRFARLKVNLSKEEIIARVNDVNDPLFILVKSIMTTEGLPMAADDEINELLKEKSKFTDFPHPVALLNINDEEKDELTNKYGIASLNAESLLDKGESYLLSGGTYKRFQKGAVQNNAFKSFINQFPNEHDGEKIDLLPSNAFVVNDSHIFTNSKKQGDKIRYYGIDNLKLLGDALMPEELNVPFHITVVTQDCKWSIGVAKEKMNELKRYYEKRRPYKVELELIVGKLKNEEHERYITSNYYKITVGKGLNHFDLDHRTVREKNDFRLEKVFKDIEEHGETPYESMNDTLKLMKKIAGDSYLITTKIGSSTGLLTYNTLQSNSIMNRLLK